MVLLSSSTEVPSDAREYLDKTNLLPSLEAGLEDMLKACGGADSKQDPINFLASWLMRNNPKFNAEAAAKIQERRDAEAAAKAEAEAAAAAAAAAAEAAAAAAAAAEAAAAAPPAAPAAGAGEKLTLGVAATDGGSVSVELFAK